VKKYTFVSKLWVWPGEKAAWRFVTVPKAESAILKEKVKLKNGFGSIRVRVTVGKTSWDTSVFPDSKSGTYLLPVKATVRRKEAIDDGDSVSVSLVVTMPR
jgi:hypothetical protein